MLDNIPFALVAVLNMIIRTSHLLHRSLQNMHMKLATVSMEVWTHLQELMDAGIVKRLKQLIWASFRWQMCGTFEDTSCKSNTKWRCALYNKKMAVLRCHIFVIGLWLFDKLPEFYLIIVKKHSETHPIINKQTAAHHQRSDLLLKHSSSVNSLCKQSSAAPLPLLLLLFFLPESHQSVNTSPPFNHLRHIAILSMLPLNSSSSLPPPVCLFSSNFSVLSPPVFYLLLYTLLLLFLHLLRPSLNLLSSSPLSFSALPPHWVDLQTLRNRNTSQCACVCVCVCPLSSHWTNRKWRPSGDTGRL